MIKDVMDQSDQNSGIDSDQDHRYTQSTFSSLNNGKPIFPGGNTQADSDYKCDYNIDRLMEQRSQDQKSIGDSKPPHVYDTMDLQTEELDTENPCRDSSNQLQINRPEEESFDLDSQNNPNLGNCSAYMFRNGRPIIVLGPNCKFFLSKKRVFLFDFKHNGAILCDRNLLQIIICLGLEIKGISHFVRSDLVWDIFLDFFEKSWVGCV